MPFSFENLDIYRKSVAFVIEVRKLCASIKTDFDIQDQLKRAALSVSLNIAEGAGRWHKKEKRHFYYIARGSLFECIPLLKILSLENHITDEQHSNYYDQTENLSKMLTKLIKSVTD